MISFIFTVLFSVAIWICFEKFALAGGVSKMIELGISAKNAPRYCRALMGLFILIALFL